MKETAIAFKPEMVLAILGGEKTQTRRMKGLERVNEAPNEWEFEGRIVDCYDSEAIGNYCFLNKESGECVEVKCSYGEVGDCLLMEDGTRLEITDIRVERVQEIAYADAKAEGVRMEDDEQDMRWNPVQAFRLLWNSIYKSDGKHWDANPWVWVISFKQVAPVETSACS